MLIRALLLSGIAAGVGTPSMAISQVTPPAAPTNLQVGVVQDALAVSLTWVDNADNEDSYVVERSTAGANGPWDTIATLPLDSTDFWEGGLEDQVTYWYRVAAVNSAGGSYSNVDFGTATALPMPPPTAAPMSPPVSAPETGDGGGAGDAAMPWSAIALAVAVALAATGAIALRRLRP